MCVLAEASLYNGCSAGWPSCIDVQRCRSGGEGAEHDEASENLVAWSGFCVAPSKRETSEYYNTSDSEVAHTTASAFTAKLTLIRYLKT